MDPRIAWSTPPIFIFGYSRPPIAIGLHPYDGCLRSLPKSGQDFGPYDEIAVGVLTKILLSLVTYDVVKPLSSQAADIEALWDRFERASNKLKAQASRRLTSLQAVDALRASGMTLTEARAQVAGQLARE